jgi:catechol 2,3-dioxygenase-like lactoylglutathione lyase family enzyme
MAESARPRVVGFNHVALEVGDIEEALAFYGRLFTFNLRGKSDSMAFIDVAGDPPRPSPRKIHRVAEAQSV